MQKKDYPNLDEDFINAADDRDFRIKLVSTLIAMLIMVGLLFAGKAVIQHVKEYIDEKNSPIDDPKTHLELELESNSILTDEELDQLEDELNELNENLDNLVIELSPKEPSGSPEE